MKTIGLIGGMSWESTADYYQLINSKTKRELGPPHSAEIIMHSVDFAEIEKLMNSDRWEQLGKKMLKIAVSLKEAGADMILICANTTHKIAPLIEENLNIPLLHIADTAASRIEERGFSKVGLLGTKYVMEGDFYKKRIKDKFDIDVITPEVEDIKLINKIIYEELVCGTFKEESRKKLEQIINKLKNRGAKGIILGCTEIPLLIKEKHSSLPIFNTSKLHAEAAVNLALK